jgi:hypothetical protein
MLITVRSEGGFTRPGTPDDAWQEIIEEIAYATEKGKYLPQPATAESVLQAANLQIYKLVPMSQEEFIKVAPGIMDILKEWAGELNCGVKK